MRETRAFRYLVHKESYTGTEAGRMFLYLVLRELKSLKRKQPELPAPAVKIWDRIFLHSKESPFEELNYKMYEAVIESIRHATETLRLKQAHILIDLMSLEGLALAFADTERSIGTINLYKKLAQSIDKTPLSNELDKKSASLNKRSILAIEARATKTIEKLIKEIKENVRYCKLLNLLFDLFATKYGFDFSILDLFFKLPTKEHKNVTNAIRSYIEKAGYFAQENQNPRTAKAKQEKIKTLFEPFCHKDPYFIFYTEPTEKQINALKKRYEKSTPREITSLFNRYLQVLATITKED